MQPDAVHQACKAFHLLTLDPYQESPLHSRKAQSRQAALREELGLALLQQALWHPAALQNFVRPTGRLI